jgi:putative SOS response-associated peptidase YedK
MIAILPPERYDDWLRADAAASHDFLQPWPAHQLSAMGSGAAPVRSAAQQSLPF